MGLSVTDARKWHENGMDILGFKEKLDNKAAGKYYSANFEDIYYGSSRDKSFGEITEACNELAKGVLNLSTNEQKGIVRDFVSTSKLASKDRKEILSFWALLKSNGWLPVDPEVVKRKRAEEAERLRRRREEERRVREARELAERKRAEEAARLRRRIEEEERRIRWAREARERKKSERIFDLVRVIALLIAAVVVVWLVIFAVKKGISSYKYYYTEYEVLIEKSEELSGQYKYTEALEALQDAKARKSSKKKIQEVERRIATVLAERDEKCATLRLEIAKVWDSYFVKNNGRVSNTLNKSIVKYVQRNDIQPLVESTLSKIELLKTISSDTKEYEVNMTKIKILKTYYKL